ncbi:hypothetical protein FPZ43_17735 [Mucilaginibacter pallidiroseus]|uniref:DoxX family protein n=1 Tax=Mucilaginibacter pallidiroseus TaxID=2599295 RepID=A0A563U249_9SPHI|nr:hypothetical protein [Mucilaginibacter pallidiroseus]TWR24739.1 hypothetical protein FPZ43_17735 [Mucilaginibacter pallidiroseus]
MVRNIIATLLLMVAVCLSFKHAWDTAHYQRNPESFKMMESLGISVSMIPAFVALTLATGILLLIPKTFFLGNMVNAMSIILIMCLALRSGNIKMALIEIPFLLMPLLMIWLKYPFKN